MNRHPEHLQTGAGCGEVASALRAAKQVILDRFIQSLTDSGVHPVSWQSAELKAATDVFLDELVGELVGEARHAEGDWMPPPSGTPEQCLAHFRLMRVTLLQELPKVLQRSLRPDEDLAINAYIDRGVDKMVGANARLLAERLQAETSAMAKFLSFLSHDLRGGLNAAVLMIEVLRRQLAGRSELAGSVEDLNIVHRSVMDTVETLERFVTAERLRIGRVPANPAQFKVADLVVDVRKRVATLLADASMRLEIDCPEGLELRSDRFLLLNILQSLVGNSVKFARSGVVHLTIRPGTECRMTVSDQGPGMAAGKIDEIFQSLARAESYSKNGVGLGLYIAYRSCELLGARLSAEPTSGKGAVFHVDLPPT